MGYEQYLKSFAYQNFSQEVIMEDKADFYRSLEQGRIVFLPNLSFQLLPNELQFLTPKAVNGSRKNVSYQPSKQQMHGDSYQAAEHEALKNMLARFYAFAKQVIQTYYPDYLSHTEIGRTSFRPVEAATREDLSYRKDDRRLHVDAFPASPNHGKRIMRVFSNINPEGVSRVWRVGGTFEEVAKQFNVEQKKFSLLQRQVLQWLSITRGFRTDYDAMMLYLHDTMKADEHYQKTCQQMTIELSAGATWIVFTDQVPHAAMSGQYCLEQTFYLPVSAQHYPEYAPLQVLQRLTERELV